METVFIAGSRNIKHLDKKVKERIDNIIRANMNVIVGDADGVDASIQYYMAASAYQNAVVYCSGARPRNNVGGWRVFSVESKHASGSRAFYTEKDRKMAEDADYGLMIWDTKSTGTLSNVIELLRNGKKTVVFVNRDKEFRTVAAVEDLENLVALMSDVARIKADQKIGLFGGLASLRGVQLRMFG